MTRVLVTAVKHKRQHSRFGGIKKTSIATAMLAGLLGSGAYAQTCSVSPDFVNWVTPGTTGWTTDSQSANITWGSASTDISINGPFFIGGTETSIIRITEYDYGRGKYTFDFLSPVVHDVKLFLGNMGRTSVATFDSAIIGDFNFGISDGSTAANLFGSVNGLDNQGYFATFSSDTEGIDIVTPGTLTGTGADGEPLDNRFWIHDGFVAPGDFNNGGEDQAYGMVDLDYVPPTTIDQSSNTISNLDFRQVGVGVGPTVAIGIQARIRSCIEAVDDDFSATPITSSTGGTTASVLTSDNLNTESVTAVPVIGNVDLAVVTPATPTTGSISLDTTTGTFNVAPNTTPGTYFVTYSLTDRPVGGVPTNTDTAVATIVVEPDFTPIVAEDDDFAASPLDGAIGGLSGNAFANDTIGLVPVDAAAVTATVITAATPNNPGNAVPFLETSGPNEGLVTVPAPTPAGIYAITYEICEDANPGNCDQAQILVGVLNGLGVDYGDAPVSYGAPIHNVPSSPSVYMGALAPDIEAAPASGAGATGDDTTNQDDEDGIVLPVLTQGVNTTLTVEVTGAGNLQAWIDYNGDGTFETPLGEQVATDLQDDGTGDDTIAGDGLIEFVVQVPVDATTAITYARFRYSSQPSLLFSDYAPDGEAEDYSLIIAAADLVDRGDAPASYGDPRHAVVPSIYLGASEPDSDVIPINSPNADADDVTAADDEDAVASFPTFTAGSTVSLTVITHETLSDANLLLPPLLRQPGVTNLQVWFDFNADGVFSASEQVATNYRDGGTGDTDGVFNNAITLDVPVPATAVNGDTFARIRWSTSSALASDPFDGFNADGEVEDYKVTIVNTTPPLTCDASFYMVGTENGTNLPLLNRLSATFDGSNYNLSQSSLPPNYTGNYLVTGWGFNEVDGYIYGVRQSPRSLMRMDGNGAVTEVADLSALGLESPDTTSDILPNGVLIYKGGGGADNRYQLLDISDAANPVNLGILDAGAGAPYGRDMAYNPVDGLLYFFDPARNLYSMDPNGGVAGTTTVNLVQAEVPLAAGKFSMDIDSVWFDQQGYIYGFDNQSRQVFALEIGTDGNRPASYDFIEIQGTINNITYQGNDGASCRGPGPFAPVLPTGSISGNAYLDQDGSDTRDAGETNLGAGIAITLYDDNGTADFSDDTLLATTDTLADGTYAFADLATGTYRIELDAADPEIPATNTIGTANPILGVAVVDGADTGAQDFGFDAASADLSITKTALSAVTGLPITTAQEGDAIDFVISVSNAGPGAPVGVQVSDIIPDGFAYVSDDAAANGDTYDAATGIWVLDQVANGATETLTIRVTMLGSGNTTNTAEIIASSLPDPDSDPGVGPATDDLSDTIADDDEASVTVVLDTGARLMAGRIFIDNGSGGGTAHDALINGAEIGSQAAVLSIFDNADVLLAQPEIAADGSWSYELDAGYAGSIKLQVQPLPGLITVSEATAGLPSLVSADAHDGTYSFTPDASSTYVGLDFGIVRSATLTQDREATVESGQVVGLQHEYTAFSTGSVSFAYSNQNMSPANAFGVTLFQDTDCDGDADTAINGSIAVSTGDRLCLVSRVAANSGLGQGSSFSYDLTAATSLANTTIVTTTQNTDRVVAGGGEGQLELSKTVRNLTQNTSEGSSNGGAVGDRLEYRIYLKNPSGAYATDVTIFDQTPAYTVLASPIPSPVTVGSGLTCTVALPASNVAGYAGDLRWDCVGSFAPGDIGSVAFEVRISP